jgi:hypothetical protein
MDCLTLAFISDKLLEVIISIKISGDTIYAFINSGTKALIYSISLITSEEVIICISWSVKVKYSGSAVNIFYSLLPNIKVPVKPSL